MKKLSEFSEVHTEEEVAADPKEKEATFKNFNEWILKCAEITPYPFSKEIYGISSTSYKFQTSMAMILSAIYRKAFILNECGSFSQEQLMSSMKKQLSNSFLEDSSYSASTTNSMRIKEFIDNFKIV